MDPKIGKNLKQGGCSLAEIRRECNRANARIQGKYKQSAEFNRITKAELINLYEKCLEKLEEIFSINLKSIEELASENSVKKDRALKNIDDIYQKAFEIDNQREQGEDFPLEFGRKMNKILEEIGEDTRFKALFICYVGYFDELNDIFRLSYRKSEVKNKFEWVFIDPETNKERMFDNYVEKQIEKGFTSNYSKYKLYMKNNREFCGIIDYEMMTLETQNPYKVFTVKRKEIIEC